MATVTVFTSERTAEIEATSIVSGAINAAGHLILNRHDGTPIDMGAVSGVQMDQGTSYAKADVFSYVGDTDPGAVPDGSVWFDTSGPTGPFASETQQGLVELATNAETIAGTDTQRAVTPAGLAALPGTRVVTISGLTESTSADSYPVGVSFMSLSSGSNWSLNSGFGAVITNKLSSNRCHQTFYSSSGGTSTPRSWMRTHNTADGGGGWTAWVQYNTTYTLDPANFVQTTAFSSYPIGWSRLFYTSANSSGWDFTGKQGEVLTYVEGDFAKQRWTLHARTGTTVEIWERTANTANGWSAWFVIAADTGWTDLSYATGYTPPASGQLRYRVRNGVVYVAGGATGTFTAGTYHAVTGFGAIPAPYRPSQVVRGGSMGTTMRPGGFEVLDTGTINLGSNGLSSMPTWLAFTTSYPLG